MTEKGKRNPQNDAEAQAWIEAVMGEKFPAGVAYEDALKDGIILCKLINVLKPGSVKKFNTSKMAFKQMENIGSFLEAAESLGVPKKDLFQTVDLYEQQNIAAVTIGIHALGRKAQNIKGYNGPTIGPKEADANRREFSEEQLRQGEGVIGLHPGAGGPGKEKERAIID